MQNMVGKGKKGQDLVGEQKGGLHRESFGIPVRQKSVDEFQVGAQLGQ